MKKLIYLVAIVFMVSCKVQEKPEFVKVSNVKVKSIGLDSVRIAADALFKNPNDVGGKLLTKGIKVSVNEESLATVSSSEFEVPARNEFTIPLVVAIPTKKILGDKSNLVLGLLNSIAKNEITVKYEGDITYKLLGFSYDYPLDYTQKIKLKE